MVMFIVKVAFINWKGLVNGRQPTKVWGKKIVGSCLGPDTGLEESI